MTVVLLNAPFFPASEALSVVTDSLAHLCSLIGPEGRFVYAHPAGDPATVLEGYNMLRHCGTLWFMLRAANAGAGAAPSEAAAIRRGVAYATGKLKPPPWGKDSGSLALVSKGAAKIGGAGLALAMLAELSGRDEGVARALRAYTLSQIEGEDFIHKRDFATGKALPFRSDYYTGEALLGLLLTDADDPRLEPLITAILTRRYGVDLQSHWMGYTACEALERGRCRRALGVAYLTDLIGGIVAGPDYRERRSSTPIACRTEALTRFLMTARRMPGLFGADLIAGARVAASENLRLQLDWYDAGQFWRGDTDRKVQIDYIQHNATAFLNWHLYETA